MYKHEPVGRGFITLSHQSWAGLCLINPRSILHEGCIRNIHPLMFDVIDDKPECVARLRLTNRDGVSMYQIMIWNAFSHHHSLVS